jgi:acyl carrier protein
MMEPMMAPFRTYLSRMARKIPQIPFVSTVTGTWANSAEVTDVEHWSRLNRNPVQFSAAVTELLRTPNRALLEVGPGTTLTSLARMHSSANTYTAVNSLPHMQEVRDESECVLTAAGRLWNIGVALDWSQLGPVEGKRRVPLPTYPFERKRYWVDGARRSKPGSPAIRAQEPTSSVAAEVMEGASAVQIPARGIGSPPASQKELIAVLSRIWCDILGVDSIAAQDNFFELGGHSLMGVILVNEVSTVLGMHIPLAMLIGAPTIERFAALIMRERAEKSTGKSIANLRDIAQELRTFLTEECSSAGMVFGDDDSFLEHKIIDESEVIHLITFIEESYGVVVKDSELNAENLGSVSRAAAYVQRKLEGHSFSAAAQ